MSTILSLAPQNVWKHFYSLTQVPRPSGHLKKHFKMKQVTSSIVNLLLPVWKTVRK